VSRIVLLLLALAAAQLAGECVFRPARGALHFAECRGWSGAIGLAILGGTFLLAGWLHRTPTAFLLIGALLGIAAAASWLRRERVGRPRGGAPAGVGTRLVELLIPAGVLLYAIRALAQPMYGYDYLIDWGLKGRTLFALGHMPNYLQQAGAVAESHPEYPHLLSLELAAVARIMGVWDDQLLAVLFIGFQIFTLAILWGYLTRRFGRGEAAVCTAIAALCVPLYSRALTGYAEIPLALGLLMAVTALLDVFENRADRWAPVRLAAASAILCATKLEGFLWVGVLALPLLGSALRPRGLRPRLPALAALAGPPLLLLALHVARGQALGYPDTETTRSLAGALRAATWPRLRGILAETWVFLVAPRLVPLGAVLLVFLASRRRESDRLLLWLAAFALLVDVGIPWVSERSVDSWVRHGSARYTLVMIPVFLIALAGRLGALFDSSSAAGAEFASGPRSSAPSRARSAPASPES
jgi:hypothetical protein